MPAFRPVVTEFYPGGVVSGPALGHQPLAVGVIGDFQPFFPGDRAAGQPSQLPMDSQALIVTLQMEASACARLSALRREHFPPDRNWLDAHITLFHALPAASIDVVLRDTAEVAASTPAFTLSVDRVLFLGAGVAYAMSSTRATGVRSALAQRWLGLLGPQDRNQRGPLHVTVQNKVLPSTARRLHTELEQGFSPYEIGATGLQVWYYMGGPWKHAGTFSFRDDSMN